MNHKWNKIGLVYEVAPLNRHPKLLTHASNPLAVHLEGDIFRVFYSGRDFKNRSSVGAVDLDVVNVRIINDHKTPFFEHGKDGTFYSDGVSIGNIYVVEDKKYMLFMGWQNPPNAHWRGDIGRLTVTDELKLLIEEDEIYRGISEWDPISFSYPWVLQCSNGEFLMWYGSTISWDSENGEMIHLIKQSVSTNGNNWSKPEIAIPLEINIAQAFSRPTVIENEDLELEMWYSYRGKPGRKYRIGYAKSFDSRNWMVRNEASGIDVSDKGWDSEMIEYPHVFKHKNQTYMLYNGNDFGKFGFGMAILEN